MKNSARPDKISENMCPNMKKSSKKLYYLYCVTKIKPPKKNIKGIGSRAYPVYAEGVYAITSKVSMDEFDEEGLKKKMADIKWIEEKVHQHEEVIEGIMKESTVVPFKFATIFQAEENIKGKLIECNDEFKQLIAYLDDKEEWGLKIYSELKKFNDTVVKDDDGIRKLDEEIAASGKGKAYLLKKKKAELIEDIIGRKISAYTRDIFEKLKSMSVESKINKILPKAVTQKNEDMVLNAAFLINKKRMPEFKDALEKLKAEYAGKCLDFDFTGPWPPYNFSSFLNER
jgi:hypothetical protein